MPSFRPVPSHFSSFPFHQSPTSACCAYRTYLRYQFVIPQRGTLIIIYCPCGLGNGNDFISIVSEFSFVQSLEGSCINLMLMALHHHQNNNGDRCTFVTSVVSTLPVFTTVQSVSVTITPKYDTYATTYGNLDGRNI